ncbi:MAG: radical SAM family heme chaperone HemW [Pseudomonadota bacterium]
MAGLGMATAPAARLNGRAGATLSDHRPDWHHGGFGLYVHWPYCKAKCPYCDFNSHVPRAAVNHAAWRQRLIAEMAHMRDLTGPRPVDTIFFGGGTPSLMAASTVDGVIEAADRLWGLRAGAEITLEANPTSVEAATFADYAGAGVNRVSIGVQALDDTDLRALGRTHSVAEALAAIEVARFAFDRVSFDLIYARQHQTADAWAAELDRALAFGPDHLSLYQLTIEEGTRFAELFARGRLTVPEDGDAAEMYAITADRTAAAGLPAYEVSNHARPGAESRHNLIYWRYGDYAGIGPGAHGRLTLADGSRIATETERDPAGWSATVARAGHAITRRDSVAPGEQAIELALMGLRLAEGVDLDRYARLAGAPLPGDRIRMLEDEGLVRREGAERERLAVTETGRPILNAILLALLA